MKFSLNALMQGAKVLAPIVAGGVIGELLTSRIPIEQYSKQIPGINSLPPQAQAFVPAAAAGAVTIVVFGTDKVAGKGGWGLMNLAAGAMLGITVNLAAKGVKSSGLLGMGGTPK